MMKLFFAAALMCAPLSAFAAAANGLGVSLPLVGRLTGSGNVLYKTAVDVTNNTAGAAQIDFYVDGVDSATAAPIGISGSLTADGAFVAQGAATVGGHLNVHFDDFLDALGAAGLIPAATRTNGFIGSALFVFNGVTQSGGGSATARFYNAMGDGTVGVALKGHEITTNEPQILTATIHDTRHNTTGAPKIYTNIFLNNTGLTPAGSPTTDTITVQVTAYSARTGNPMGTGWQGTIGPGKTQPVPTNVFGLSDTETSAIVVARVVAGGAAIEGLVSQVDNATKDGSAFEMGRGQ